MEPIKAWDLYSEHLWNRCRTELNEAQQWLAAVCDLRQWVNADGFDGYFSYWGGNSAHVARIALPTILGEQWAQLLKEGMEWFGDDYPLESDTRLDLIIEREDHAMLHELDSRFFDLEASVDADARLDRYVELHPEVLDQITLPPVAAVKAHKRRFGRFSRR